MAVKRGRQTGRRPANHSALRELNRVHVLDVIRSEGPLSRSDLVALTGLAKPTVTAIVQDLLASSIVREQGTRPAAGGGGRPAILLEFDPRHRLVVGCHIGNRRISAMVAGLDGRPIATRHRPASSRSVRVVLERLLGLIRVVLADARSDEPPLAVAVTLPGLIDSTSGDCIQSTWLGWRGVPVAELVARKLGVPVTARNDAKAAVMAEVAEGAAQGEQDVVLMFEDQGIGTGIISGGSLLHGVSGVAGEIGHCYVPGATDRCNCGKVGCLETVASAMALAAATRQLIGGAEAARLPRHPGLGDLAALGDRRVDALLERAGREVGVAASWLVNVLNPQSLVLGGGFPEAGSSFLEAFEEALDHQSLADARSRVVVRRSAIPEGAEVRGAVLAALELAGANSSDLDPAAAAVLIG